MKDNNFIVLWIDSCINGPSGLLAYEDREVVARTEIDEIVAATWILRCLANPLCKGSGEVLKAINDHRSRIYKNRIKEDKP